MGALALGQALVPAEGFSAAVPAAPGPAPTPAVPAEPVAPPPAARPAAPPLPARTHIGGIRHEYQRLNNCGPVTVGMALSAWGSRLTQGQIAPVLKPNQGDKNVSSEELAAYARAQGFRAVLAEQGDRPLLQRLLAAGYPVVVETWFVTPDDGGMGHFQLLTGYDDARGVFSALDSYEGRVTLPYARFDALWRGYARRFLVVYPAKQAEKVGALLEGRDGGRAAREAELRAALKDAGARPDAFGHLNVGLAKLRLGDARGAARAFDAARAVPRDAALDPTRPAGRSGHWPWRTLWYRFEPLEAYLRVGRFAEVERLASEVLRDTPGLEEALYWRGRARAAQGDVAGARADFRAALAARASYQAARDALTALPTH